MMCEGMESYSVKLTAASFLVFFQVQFHMQAFFYNKLGLNLTQVL